jgi:hypothetical protein
MLVSLELNVDACINRTECRCLYQQNCVWMLVSVELSVDARINRTECGCLYQQN